jgi:hypothetical protein
VPVGSTSITINQASSSQTLQTIDFGPLSNQVLGATPPALSATASSGLTVGFTSGSTSVCTVSGTTVTLVAAGTCWITAYQGGTPPTRLPQRCSGFSTLPLVRRPRATSTRMG